MTEGVGAVAIVVARRGDLLGAVVGLRQRLGAVRLPLRLDGDAGADEARRLLHGIVSQLDDYVIPRLRQLDAPLLTVVGGSTGAGKSTLVNSIVGTLVTTPGVLRPTTRSPVLVHHPTDARWFEDTRVLPSLPRTTGQSADASGLQLVSTDSLPPGLALLDAPDLDSVVAANRVLSAQLLAAADLWVFVTTAARYADAVPWEMLRAAAERSTALAVVLDRVPAAGGAEITRHLAQMLASHELGDAPVFVVGEVPLEANGMLPEEEVEPIRTWLNDLAADAATRADVARRSVDGAVRSLTRRVADVAAQADRQSEVGALLRLDIDEAYVLAAEAVDEASQDGNLLRGEVLARWQDFVGTGELLRGLEEKLGNLRDKVSDYFRARPEPGFEVAAALETGLEAVILSRSDEAAERVVESWSSRPGGLELIDGRRDELAHRTPDLEERTARAIRDWQGFVLDLVRAEGQGKRTTARFLSLGVNGLGVALMVAVFAHTGGLTGIEVGVAGGTGVVSQRVLEAVFGDQAVRSLTMKAREDLRERVAGLLVGERARYDQLLQASSIDPETGPELRAALRAVEVAR